MTVPVRGDFVSRIGNGANRFWSVLGKPSQNEESAGNAVSVEAVQKRVDATRNTTRAREPFVRRHDRLERFNLEILLDVDSKEVRRRGFFGWHC